MPLLRMRCAIAQVYQVLADKTILGSERIGERQRGKTVEDVAGILADALTGSRDKAS